MVLYRCINKYPGGPKLDSILREQNHKFHYLDSDRNDCFISKNSIEEFPVYFTKVDALIHSFKNQRNYNIYTLNIDAFPNLEYCGESAIMKFATCISRYQINSVLKVSTGEIYKKGNYVVYKGMIDRPLKIDEFKIYDGIIFAHYEGDPPNKWFDDFIGYCSPFEYDEDKANKEQQERFNKKYSLSCSDIFKFVNEKYPSINRSWERQHFYNFIKENKIESTSNY